MLHRTLLLTCLAASLHAAVTRIEISERSDVLAGKSFGAAGAYERLVGKAHFAVDPKLPANQIVADIDKAPRNDAGLVEFSADLYILKPRDPARGNGAVLYEVSNRGGKGMLGMFNRASGSTNPRTAAELGDGFLMEQGYTLVWLGWQFDVPRTEGLMRVYTPVARDGAQAITGPVRSEIVVDRKEFSHSLADRNHIPYPFANPADPSMTLTVRDGNLGARRTIPRGAWKIVEGTHLSYEAGFEPGKIYELVYIAKDPSVIGLGPAAIRDMMSFLKYGIADKTTALADQSQFIKRAYGFGTSQSGRFLRTFLYFGFNGDEAGRKVFDAVIPHVSGAGRGAFNMRFGQPSRDGHPYLNTFYPVDLFPFTDLEQTDPETGLAGGLLLNAEKAKVAPKIFYTFSSYEYYGRIAALIHSSVDGKQDAPLSPNTRVYFFTGGQHGPAAFPPVHGPQQNLPTSVPYTWSMRALLPALDNWVTKNVEPPASQYPRVADGNLIPLASLKLPKVPGLTPPTHPQRAYRVDYGPEFPTKGIITIEPPKVGKAFPTMVPQVDSDGNETTGVRMPEVQVPLGTYAGWNHRIPEIGAPDELFSMVGSFVPFAKTKAEREAKHDPRPSIAERYPSREEYLKRFESAAINLAAGGYLLIGDVSKIVERGGAEWDYVVSR